MMLLLAMLRAHGVPVRGRRGFGSYFNPGFFEDHAVCEYWNADESRWVLVDPQFDEVWQARLHIDHDVLDVPRDRFLIAGDAWVQCRSGRADPSKFGIFKGDLRQAFFDRLAALTRSPDASFTELRRLYDEDESVSVPATVYNAVLNRSESV